MGLVDRLLGRNRSASPATPVQLDSPEMFDDPYPLYGRLRRVAPIVQVRTGGYLLTRHADVRVALTHPDFGNTPSRFSALNERFRHERVAADLAANILPFLDPPEHTRLRRHLASGLRTRLQDFLPELDDVARRFVDAAPEDGFEVVGGVAAPYTRAVMCRLLGLPEADGPQLAALSDHFFRLFAPLTDANVLEDVNRGLEAFRSLVRNRLDQAPPTSLLALMAETGSEGDRLTDAQVVDSAILIFADGVENVATGVGCVLLAAHRSGEGWDALEGGGNDAAAAVSEGLRLDSPAQIIPRIAQRETQLFGQRVAAGMPIFLALGSANRDGDIFDAPDDFRLERDRRQVLTFGASRHFCLGAGLAEAQILALTSALCRRGYRVDMPPAGVRYRRRIGHRWLEALPVRRSGAGQTSR